MSFGTADIASAGIGGKGRRSCRQQTGIGAVRAAERHQEVGEDGHFSSSWHGVLLVEELLFIGVVINLLEDMTIE